MSEWQKTNWRKARVQMPDYLDQEALNAVESQLSTIHRLSLRARRGI